MKKENSETNVSSKLSKLNDILQETNSVRSNTLQQIIQEEQKLEEITKQKDATKENIKKVNNKLTFVASISFTLICGIELFLVSLFSSSILEYVMLKLAINTIIKIILESICCILITCYTALFLYNHKPKILNNILLKVKKRINNKNKNKLKKLVSEEKTIKDKIKELKKQLKEFDVRNDDQPTINRHQGQVEFVEGEKEKPFIPPITASKITTTSDKPKKLSRVKQDETTKHRI